MGIITIFLLASITFAATIGILLLVAIHRRVKRTEQRLDAIREYAAALPPNNPPPGRRLRPVAVWAGLAAGVGSLISVIRSRPAETVASGGVVLASGVATVTILMAPNPPVADHLPPVPHTRTAVSTTTKPATSIVITPDPMTIGPVAWISPDNIPTTRHPRTPVSPTPTTTTTSIAATRDAATTTAASTPCTCQVISLAIANLQLCGHTPDS